MKQISWVGTVASICGAFLVALQFALIGYAAFIVGSSTWLAVGVARKDFALITLNATFFVANIIGLYYALV